MKVYDRYYGDSTSERNRYVKEEINSRFNTIQKNRFIMGAVLSILVGQRLFLFVWELLILISKNSWYCFLF